MNTRSGLHDLYNFWIKYFFEKKISNFYFLWITHKLLYLLVTPKVGLISFWVFNNSGLTQSKLNSLMFWKKYWKQLVEIYVYTSRIVNIMNMLKDKIFIIDFITLWCWRVFLKVKKLIKQMISSVKYLTLSQHMCLTYAVSIIQLIFYSSNLIHHIFTKLMYRENFRDCLFLLIIWMKNHLNLFWINNKVASHRDTCKTEVFWSIYQKPWRKTIKTVKT
jgi:hypothetical protein